MRMWVLHDGKGWGGWGLVKIHLTLNKPHVSYSGGPTPEGFDCTRIVYVWNEQGIFRYRRRTKVVKNKLVENTMLIDVVRTLKDKVPTWQEYEA